MVSKDFFLFSCQSPLFLHQVKEALINIDTSKKSTKSLTKYNFEKIHIV